MTSSNSSETTIELTNDVNRYSYKPYGLFIPYVLANVLTFVCVCIGGISFVIDGVLPGRKVQDLIWAARRHFALSSRKLSLAVEGGGKGDIMLDVAEVEDVEGNAGVGWRKMSFKK